MENLPATPENKSADVASAFDEFKRTFEEYKEPYEVALSDVAGGGSPRIRQATMTTRGGDQGEWRRCLDSR